MTTIRELPVISAGEHPPEIRVKTSVLGPRDVAAAVGAAISATCLTLLLFREVAPLSGGLGFVVIAYVIFLATYSLIVAQEDGLAAVRDRIASVFMHSLAFLLLSVLAFVVGFTAFKGVKALPHGNFFTDSMANAGPLDPLTLGGVAHAMVGTLEQITIALVLTIPLGIAGAVFLNEIPGRLSRLVRTIAEAMTALPSIVAGLFIYATWILALGFGKSGFAAALALSVMMLPIIIRAADVVVRLVPGSLKEASLALGCGQWRTVWHVILPTARSGLTTAIILGAARGIGETSPVLVTAGFTSAMNSNPFKGPQVSLPLAVFKFVGSPLPTMIIRGFGAALVLLTLVLVLFISARLIGGRGPGNLSKRQLRRRLEASKRDLARFDARGFGVAAPNPSRSI